MPLFWFWSWNRCQNQQIIEKKEKYCDATERLYIEYWMEKSSIHGFSVQSQQKDNEGLAKDDVDLFERKYNS